MKRIKSLVFAGFSLMCVVMAFTMFTGLYSEAEADGNPFDALWAAIVNLQTQIANIELLPGPPGEPGPPGLDGSSPHLYGVNGTDLGMVVSFDGSVFFLFVPGPDVILKVRSGGGIKTDTSHTFHFTGNNCTGTAYADTRAPPHQHVIVYQERNPFAYRYFVEVNPYTGFLNGIRTLSSRRSGQACVQHQWPITVNNVYAVQEVFLPYGYQEAYPPIELRLSDN